MSQFDLDQKVVYDPACSTGQFLYSIKQKFPKCTTVGQDLSIDMVKYASNYVDKVYSGNAIRPAMEQKSCDFIFIRFLNQEVVTRKEAYEIIPKIRNCLSENGKMIVLGHTPVLLNPDYLEKLDLSCTQKIGIDKNTNSIFQYFVFENLV